MTDRGIGFTVGGVIIGIKVLESDCVCEKKENARTPSDKCLHGYLLSEPCKHCILDRKFEKGVEWCQTSEKKKENDNESYYTTSPQSCRVCGTTEVTTLVHGACLPCIGVLIHESVMKEKQSQSPCEHEWEKIFLPAFTVLNDHWQPQLGESPNSLFPLYICRRKACGLVTCIDPNQ